VVPFLLFMVLIYVCSAGVIHANKPRRGREINKSQFIRLIHETNNQGQKLPG
jgi:hypothetical protein